MTPVALVQTGIIHRLPDIPVRGFDSEAVTLSREAYSLGVPDGCLSLASFAANVPLAALAGRRKWLAVLTAKAALESTVSAWYFRRQRAWCSYCLVAAAANFTVLGLAIAELAGREG